MGARGRFIQPVTAQVKGPIVDLLPFPFWHAGQVQQGRDRDGLRVRDQRQLGLHEKPVILLNTEGYWDPLIGLIDHVIDQGFADPSLKGYISVVADVETLVDSLRAALS